jgi:hypothetical protein
MMKLVHTHTHTGRLSENADPEGSLRAEVTLRAFFLFLDVGWRDLCSFMCTAVESFGEFLALFNFCISAKTQDLSTKGRITSPTDDLSWFSKGFPTRTD